MHAAARRDKPHCRFAVIDDLRIFQIEEYPQPEHIAGVPRDATVTEVQTEEIDVLRREVVKPMAWMAAVNARRHNRVTSIERAGMLW
jgi:hypothetical protein